VARVAADALAPVAVVRQRNARGAVETRSRPTPTNDDHRLIAPRDRVRAQWPQEAGRTLADEVADQVVARAAVHTRRTRTVVDVRLAEHALETCATLASEVVDGVDAARAVETRITATVVHISLTHRAFKTSRTDAMESVHSVHALTTCLQHNIIQTRERGTPAVDITAMTSSGHVTSSVTSPFDSAWPLSYRLPIVNNPRSPVVSEIFSMHARRTKRHLGTHPSRRLGITSIYNKYGL